MKHIYVVIYRDADELVYTPVAYKAVVKFFGDKNLYFNWNFTYEDNEINVYTAALSAMPVGENREEMEQRILAAVDLI